jgi:hypothetical protein
MSDPSDRNIINWVIPSNTSALCDAIPVFWQNTDVQILSLLGAPPKSSTYSMQPGSSPAETGTSSILSALTPHSSLSGGGKAAIGITIPLLFLALIAGAFLVFRSRNSGIQQEPNELPTSSPSIEGSSWTQLNEMQKQKNEASELDSTVVSEAGGGNHAVELGDWRRSVVYEMEGSFGGAGGWRGGEREEQERRAQHHQT